MKLVLKIDYEIVFLNNRFLKSIFKRSIKLILKVNHLYKPNL